MQTDQIIIDKLTEFKQRDKFSTNAWNERGLNPSSDEMCRHLNLFFDKCTDQLIKVINERSLPKHLKDILKSELLNLNKSDYDTEEKEFICDLFSGLAAIVNVDIRDNLNKWLYGVFLTTLMKIQKVIRQERIIETIRHSCIKCETKLETHILRKEDGIPETSWLVAKCNNCGEFNLLSHGPNLKETRFENYQLVDTLLMKEYTYDQALTRLEQIKYFRK